MITNNTLIINTMINRLDLKGKEQGLTYVTKNCVTLTKELKNIKQTVN